MSNNRLQRVNEDIARELGALFRKIRDPRIAQAMVSVTEVETTSDLKQAKVYLSAFGISSEKEMQKGLKSATGYLRSELGRALKLRNTPELVFILDDSIERGSRINTILANLDIPEDDEE
ncbi:MAG: 30S ribosome-binding factor RbfA [Oscillospiraceae bacterium]|nr:30S ribosome-binding factor RbfA [Oscillospiraceae bacterium]